MLSVTVFMGCLFFVWISVALTEGGSSQALLPIVLLSACFILLKLEHIRATIEDVGKK